MPGCSAPNCSKHSRNGYRLFVFPRDLERRWKWLKNCRRDLWIPTDYSRICEYHFEDSQFEQARKDGRKKLKPNAVPTIFNVLNCSKKFESKGTQPREEEMLQINYIKDEENCPDYSSGLSYIKREETANPVLVKFKQEAQMDVIKNKVEFSDKAVKNSNIKTEGSVNTIVPALKQEELMDIIKKEVDFSDKTVKDSNIKTEESVNTIVPAVKQEELMDIIKKEVDFSDKAVKDSNIKTEESVDTVLPAVKQEELVDSIKKEDDSIYNATDHRDIKIEVTTLKQEEQNIPYVKEELEDKLNDKDKK